MHYKFALKTHRNHKMNKISDSELFGPIADKWDFAQMSLFRRKCSKNGQKYIGTIKKHKKMFDYSTKNYHESDHVPNFFNHF